MDQWGVSKSLRIRDGFGLGLGVGVDPCLQTHVKSKNALFFFSLLPLSIRAWNLLSKLKASSKLIYMCVCVHTYVCI